MDQNIRKMDPIEQIAFLNSILESSTQYSIIAKDLDGYILTWNAGAERFYGYKPKEVFGKNATMLHDPKDIKSGKVKEILNTARKKGQWVGELQRVRKDGSQFPALVSLTLRSDTQGKPVGFTLISRDITDQKKLEQELNEQNQELSVKTAYLHSILKSSTGFSIIIKDLKGNILEWNEGAHRNYGYTAKEIIGKNSAVLHEAEDIKSGRIQELYDTALKTGSAEGIYERVRKNGKKFTALLNLSLRTSPDGKPLGYVLISKDITEQKRLEEQLRIQNKELEAQSRKIQEANRLKSEFLANMSHELRTPLNGIMGFTELMMSGKVGEPLEKHKEYLGDILSSSQHLLQLINDVLDLAKVESGKMEFSPEEISLTKIIGEVCDILRTLLAKKQIQLEIKIDPLLDKIVIDPAKLKQVLYNYVSNAIKFTSDGGKIAICVKPEGTTNFRLEVKDSGVGIREEDLGRLFVEFQQLDASIAKKYQGTGLGLALTRRIAEAQGGHVGVNSVFGKGSTFYIILPRKPRDISTIKILPSVTKPLTATHLPTVLVIEDDANDRAQIKQTLTDAGYAVETAKNGAEALRLAKTRPFHALTLDLILPDMNGWDVLRDIRRSKGPNKDIPVIVVTVVAEKSSSFGVALQDYLIKPIKSDELLASLNRTKTNAASKSVLVIDDDKSALKLAKLSLDLAGYQTLCANSGKKGLEVAKQEHPDIVVLDLLMPEMDGFEFLQHFRRIKNNHLTPVIIWSIKDLTHREREQLRTSAQAVISKGPKSTSNLLEELQNFALTPKESKK